MRLAQKLGKEIGGTAQKSTKFFKKKLYESAPKNWREKEKNFQQTDELVKLVEEKGQYISNG